MKYSELIKKACNISFEAHKEDKDKGGYPYVYHPFYLASQFNDEDAVCVALLHDVIEDHGDKYSFEYLEKEGFNKNIIDALKLLTHNDEIEYLDYINLIKGNDLARRVKMADLNHNMDISRNGGDYPPKISNYRKAFSILAKENDFLIQK